MSADKINHPPHYTSHPSGVECITITRHMTFNIGNAVKYLWRNGLKDGNPAVDDLRKAIFYIQDEINAIEGTPDVNQFSLNLETQKAASGAERTIECAACGASWRPGDFSNHAPGCPNIQRMDD